MFKNRFLYLILFLGLLFNFNCSKSSSSSSNKVFTLTGTVYVDNVPTAGIDVEFQIATGDPNIGNVTWDSTVRKTDSNGKYKFERGGFREWTDYRVRAKNPFTHAYTNFKTGRAFLGTTKTEDFYFTSQ